MPHRPSCRGPPPLEKGDRHQTDPSDRERVPRGQQIRAIYQDRSTKEQAFLLLSRIHAFQNGQGERFVHFRIPREEELR